MLFYIACADRPGALQLRLDTRADHLAYLEGFQDKIVFGGPTLGGEEETPNGSVLIVDMEDRAAVESFAAGDPYAKAGLFENVTISPIKQVFPK